MSQRAGLCLSLLAVVLMTTTPLQAAVSQGPSCNGDEAFLESARNEIGARSVRGLRGTGYEGHWDFLTSEDGKIWKREASFVSMDRLELPQLQGAPAERVSHFDNFERSLLVGQYISDLGEVKFMAGLLVDFGVDFADQDGAVLRAFAPFEINDSYDHPLGKAREIEKIYRSALEDGTLAAQGAMRPGPIDEGDPCKNGCTQAYNSDVAACDSSRYGCRARCWVATLVCLQLCLATPPCIAACLALEILCLADCESDFRACTRSAVRDYQNCIRDCHP